MQQPAGVQLSSDGAQLIVLWGSGKRVVLSAARLRDGARDARSIRDRINKCAIPAPEDLTITGLQKIGSYGLRISFSDGHDRAIFPWTYLAEFASAA